MNQWYFKSTLKSLIPGIQTNYTEKDFKLTAQVHLGWGHQVQGQRNLSTLHPLICVEEDLSMPVKKAL